MKINLEYGILWIALISGMVTGVFSVNRWGKMQEEWEKRKKASGEDFDEKEPDRSGVWRVSVIVTIVVFFFLLLMCKTFGWIPS